MENLEKEYMWLPQMGENNHEYVLSQLTEKNIGYKIDVYNPNELKPLKECGEGSLDFFTEKINNREKLAPLYISVDNEVIDGSKRLNAYRHNPDITKVYCIKLFTDVLNGASILSKIQDRYDWEVNNNFIKGYEPMVTDNGVNTTDDDFIDDLDNTQVNEVEDKENPKTLTLYRSKPMNMKSKSGNFLLTEKKPMFDKEITLEFDNLYEIPHEEIEGIDNPVEYILEKWLGEEVNLREEATKHALQYEAFLPKKVAEECKRKGYDGVKYGNMYVQAI